MALFKERFDSWSAADLAAYEPQKWASKRFNLERGRVRLRLISLLEQIAERAQLPIEGLEIWTSRDHPNIFNSHKVERQWAVWCRPTEQRRQMARFDATLAIERPLDSHLHVGVIIDGGGLTLVLRLPAGARFDQGLRQGLLDGLDAAAVVEQDGQVERRVHHPAASLLAGAVDLDHIQSWMVSIWPAFRAGLWSPEQDPEGLAEALAAEPKPAPAPEPAVSPTPARPQIAPPQSRSPDPVDLAQPRRAPIAGPGSARPRRPSRPTEPRQRPDRRPTAGATPARPRGTYKVRPDPTKAPVADLAPGSTVYLKYGLFGGKQGVVERVSGDKVQVAVGAISLAVRRDELELV